VVVRDRAAEAAREAAGYKQTVTSLEDELNSARDVETMLNEQVTAKIVL